MSKTIVIIGAGLAGLSAALQAAKNGCNVKLVSSLPSERAQSVMAVSYTHLLGAFNSRSSGSGASRSQTASASLKNTIVPSTSMKRICCLLYTSQTARLYKIDGLDSEADEGAGIDLGRRKIIADPPFVC